jgi:hypothetical protein
MNNYNINKLKIILGKRWKMDSKYNILITIQLLMQDLKTKSITWIDVYIFELRIILTCFSFYLKNNY